MSPMDAAASGLQRNLDMVNGTLSDFSDADFYTRPCPGANHPAWQIGHLISSESRSVAAFDPKAAPKLPDGFDKKFTKETAGKDDPAFFGSKAQLLDQLAKTRAATIAWVKTLEPADLDKPAPEQMRRYVPTLGDFLVMIPIHTAMHVGQFQVTRRKLGKPIMF
jgi:DinB superfamily